MRFARRYLRDSILSLFRRLSLSEQGREVLMLAVRSGRQSAPRFGWSCARELYDELPCAQASEASRRDDLVFVTARFRSGSTLLWNIFRNVPGVTAYYEPFNERRWFDPEMRGSQVDATHREVGDYWREYDGLQELGKLYDEDWIRRDLYMDADAWAPEMKRYVERLIERSPGRPVLQFNRIDFRLPWFRKHFPRAKIVHLVRHPRDQWLSTLMDRQGCGPNVTTAEFARRDGFYLLMWAKDLRWQFPFLEPARCEHPYEIFYYIWRLSSMFGSRFADHQLRFEDLLGNHEAELSRLFQRLGIGGVDMEQQKALLSPPTTGRWRSYADERWFRAIEDRCESGLADFFGMRDGEQ